MQYIKITYTNKNITIRVIKYTLEVRERNDMLKKYKIENNRNWKEKNKNYLKELQNFFDKADNIEDQNLRQNIISQMLKCDNILTQIAESRFKKFYELGYNNAKRE